jgi:LysM domain
MARGMNRALLFLAGGVAAAAVTAYVTGALDPYLGKKTEPATSVSEAPAPQPEVKEGRLPAQPQAETAKAPEAAAPAATEQPAATEAAQAPAAQPATGAGADIKAPSFDLVRAEGDGSLVIAGKAAANSKIEIVLGAKVIGNAVAGPEGDFAVALDEPLKPGDHQIVLRSTSPDNVVATSPETAVVSIPENKDGQVLALVEQPGAPSKLISVPEPEAKQPEQAASAGEAAKPAETAAATEPAAQKPDQQASAAAAQPADKAAPAAAGTGATVKVEAVEIEGRKVFVAGSADAGRKVRVYANDILLGEVVTSPGGRFLIETERDLPAGDYVIRADALEEDGVKVAARAAVPFEREAAEAQSAVAPTAAEQPAAAVEPAKATPATETAASAEPAKPASSTEVAAAAPEAMSPKLQNVDGAVIIRRGDSLWRISRRVYGLGVRYSTIYLANQERIRDPNRIWPGQVFKVPEKTAHGEAADMKAVGEQATTLPQ